MTLRRILSSNFLLQRMRMETAFYQEMSFLTLDVLYLPQRLLQLREWLVEVSHIGGLVSLSRKGFTYF
ncbi:hypothetical protein FRX31_030100 [Thalictrum thalictroides]|uniref:Uncharacterized protein n=1 Tax=Thalictrum thalictroides TaxID=46969 RepID=A0A7J6V5W8_THATH|nr:hypothetical protein FRX31_030100 [Thalictrum thalictroides]